LKAAGVWPHGCVEAVEAGLGDGTEGSGTGDDSSAAFTFYPCMPGNSTTRPAEKARLQGGCMHPAFFEGASEVQCTVTTLSRLMRDYRLATIELLKVDVEGAELSVLQGIDADHWRHIAQVTLTVAPPMGLPIYSKVGGASTLREGAWVDLEQVVMEVHDVDGRLAEVVSLLMVHGYTLAVESLENCPEFSFMVWATRDCINSPAD
jgi:FkbM family methyltransferase